MPMKPTTHRPAQQAAEPATQHEGASQEFARTLRNSNVWKKLSRAVRVANPLCSDPFGTHNTDGRVEPSTQVHHIARLTHAPEKALTTENLSAVCVDCHGRLGAMEALGRSTAHLFT